MSKMIKWMIVGLVLTAVMTYANVIETGMIPYHGIFLKISMFEWLMLLWVPASAAIFAKRGQPTRWWLWYALLSFLIMWPGIRRGVLCTLWGRRPWMPSEYWLLKSVVVLAAVAIATVLAAAWKMRRNENNTSEGICR